MAVCGRYHCDERKAIIRTHNARLTTFALPLPSTVPADERGVVNECAFLLFASALKNSVPPSDLPKETVAACADEALRLIARMGHFSRVPPTPITEMGMRDAKVLARRLTSYFNSKPWELLRTKPFFPGCGWVDDSEGDVLGDRTLFEIKAGERQFRGTDVRQLLCYCALSFSAKLYDITTICLINPRFGTYFQDDLETLCQRTAGMSAAAVLGEIVNYVSEPFSRYRTG
jgi:hypothetical protein